MFFLLKTVQTTLVAPRLVSGVLSPAVKRRERNFTNFHLVTMIRRSRDILQLNI